MSPKPPDPSSLNSISAAAFPALRSFLRGYFHQDMMDEYGSLEEAVRQFCEDAPAEERKTVAEEWTRFAAQTQGWPLAVINLILTERLGSASLLQPGEVESISRTFRECGPS